jgi:hypothetical protein
LETLARAQIIENSVLVPLLEQARYHLAWGTSLIVITGSLNRDVLDGLHQARRAGQNALVILAGGDTSDDAARQRAKAFGIPVFSIATERDLHIWTRQTGATRRS